MAEGHERSGIMGLLIYMVLKSRYSNMLIFMYRTVINSKSFCID